MTPDPLHRHSAALDQARQALAGAAMTDHAFIAHLRRFAEANRWMVINTTGGNAVQLVCARRGRIVFIGTATKPTASQAELVEEFGLAAGAETYAFTPAQVDDAEAVLA